MNAQFPLTFCNVTEPYLTQLKGLASYVVPKIEMLIAAVFQSNPGPTYNANATFTTAQVAPTLGRPLSGGVRTVTLNLVAPFSQFGPRINQFDLRVVKAVKPRRTAWLPGRVGEAA